MNANTPTDNLLELSRMVLMLNPVFVPPIVVQRAEYHIRELAGSEYLAKVKLEVQQYNKAR